MTSWYGNSVEFIGKALATVGPFEREVACLVYGIDAPRHTAEEVAQLRGLSEEQVSQTVKKVIRRLRHPDCVPIVREAVEVGDERIWRSMADAAGIVYGAGIISIVVKQV